MCVYVGMCAYIKRTISRSDTSNFYYRRKCIRKNSAKIVAIACLIADATMREKVVTIQKAMHLHSSNARNHLS